MLPNTLEIIRGILIHNPTETPIGYVMETIMVSIFRRNLVMRFNNLYLAGGFFMHA